RRIDRTDGRRTERDEHALELGRARAAGLDLGIRHADRHGRHLGGHRRRRHRGDRIELLLALVRGDRAVDGDAQPDRGVLERRGFHAAHTRTRVDEETRVRLGRVAWIARLQLDEEAVAALAGDERVLDAHRLAVRHRAGLDLVDRHRAAGGAGIRIARARVARVALAVHVAVGLLRVRDVRTVVV